MRILVTEDESTMRDLLGQALMEDGYDVQVSATAERAIDLAAQEHYDAIVLDVMLPRADGFTACERMRRAGVTSPILMLTARDDVRDRVRGLDAGADDYLCKPFSLDELLARVRALVRRAGGEGFGARIAVGDLALDTEGMRAWRGSTQIELTAREFAVLEVLVRKAGAVVPRHVILDAAWDGEADHRSNVIEVLVRRIREKVDRPFGRSSIETVRGAGYRVRRE
jgi:two-component system OmpR family response regulator